MRRPENYIIGVNGLKRSGKDTFGSCILPLLPVLNTAQIRGGEICLEPLSWRIDSFAAPLRQMANAMFGVTEENREEDIPGIEMTGRKLLQRLGTEVCRQIHPQTWVESMKYRNDTRQGLIITDVRFQNEAEFIHDNGGIVVNISRPSVVASDKHVSEAGIRPEFIDYWISNEGTLADLYTKCEQFVRDYTAAWNYGAPQS